MDKRCATCKHWVASNEWDVKVGGLRRCSAVRERWVVEDEIPQIIAETNHDDPYDIESQYANVAELVFDKVKAVVQDGSQYMAELLTRHDFGCVLHKDKAIS